MNENLKTSQGKEKNRNL